MQQKYKKKYFSECSVSTFNTLKYRRIWENKGGNMNLIFLWDNSEPTTIPAFLFAPRTETMGLFGPGYTPAHVGCKRGAKKCRGGKKNYFMPNGLPKVYGYGEFTAPAPACA